jgi:valyl-tRNA synthetase
LHLLSSLPVLNPDGTINEGGGPFEGMSREEARLAVVERLDEEGLLGEVRDYTFRVGHCDRCGTGIEPWLSEQWWVSMKELAAPAIEALKKRRISVYPDSWRRETIRWLENIHDWNVSRQLWWGHRIPAWYCPDGHVTVARETPASRATSWLVTRVGVATGPLLSFRGRSVARGAHITCTCKCSCVPCWLPLTRDSAGSDPRPRPPTREMTGWPRSTRATRRGRRPTTRG